MRFASKSKHHFKGKWLPSWNERIDDAPRKVLVWAPNTQAVGSRVRRLRQRCRHIIDSHDPQIISIGDRVIRLVCDEPHPEYSALHLFASALTASEETGETWEVCMMGIIVEFERRRGMSEAAAEVEAHGTTAQPTAGSQISRLLRSLVPKPLRKGNEEVPQGSGPTDREGSGERKARRHTHLP